MTGSNLLPVFNNMKHILLTLYVVATSASLGVLNKNIEKTKCELQRVVEILDHHESVLKDHREAVLLVIEKLNGKYI